MEDQNKKEPNYCSTETQRSPSQSLNEIDDEYNIDKITRDLEAIEAKHEEVRYNFNLSPLLSQKLKVLCSEFDSLSLPPMKNEGSLPYILEQVVDNSRHLVHIHINTIRELKEKCSERGQNDVKLRQLQLKIDEYNGILNKLNKRCQRHMEKESLHEQAIAEYKQSILDLEKQLKQIKSKLASQDETFQRKVKVLEEHHDKQLRGTFKGFDPSKDEILSNLRQTYRDKEDMHKETVINLQERNRELMQEILTLKEELILCRARK